MDRRQFLAGLFGAVAVAAAGPIPTKLLELPDEQFAEKAKFFAELKEQAVGGIEMYANRVTGEYSFTPLPGFEPMLEESRRLEAQALKALKEFYGEFS